MLDTTLDLDANPFVAALTAVNSAVDKFSGRITAVSSLFSGLRDASDMVMHVFEKFATVLDLGGELSDLSAATGEAKGELLVLEQAFQNAGKGAQDVGPFIAKLHKAIGGINEEGKNTAAAFAALNTSAEELRNLPVTEQVAKMSEGFAGLTDASDRGQVAMNLFGKSGEELLALFRDQEAIATARTQVGGLAGTIEKIAPLLDNIGDALGAVNRKFEQLAAGFIAGGDFQDFSAALNAIDLTSIGEMLGKVAGLLIDVGKALKPLLPVVLALGAGWLASMAATQIASIGIVAAVRSVVAATVTGIRAIMVSLGPYGIAIAALTYLWLKLRDSADQAPDAPAAGEAANSAAASASNPFGSLGVSDMTKRGLSAFTGVSGFSVGGSDPVASRVDRSNALLEQIASNTAPKQVGDAHTKRPNLPV